MTRPEIGLHPLQSGPIPHFRPIAYLCAMFKRLILLAATCLGQLGLHAQTVDASSFEKGIQGKDVQVFDVRTAAEFRSGHLSKALQADFNNKEEFRDRVQYLDKTKPVYVYCLAGIRSANAAKWMRENGFKEVVELQGGVNAWKQAGKPLDGVVAEKQLAVADFEKSVAVKGLVLVDVGAEWCPPCRTMAPVIEQFVQQKGKTLTLVKVDGGRDTEVMKSLSAVTLPTFILYKNGKEVWRKEGVVSLEDLNTAAK